MKKILISTLNLNNNINLDAIICFLSYIDYKKYDVDLLLYEDKNKKDLEIDNVNIIYYKDYMLKPFKPLEFLNKKILVQQIYDKQRFAFKKRYDISIAFDGNNNYIDMVAASVKSKKKIIFVNEDLSLKRKKLGLNKYNYFDLVLCLSSKSLRIINKKLPNCKNKTKKINKLINIKYIEKLAKEKSSFKPGKEYNIVSCVKEKIDYKTICNIAKEIKKRNANIKLYIIGEPKNYYKLVNIIKTHNLYNEIILLGNQNNPYNIIKQADLYLDLSINNFNDNYIIESIILDIPFITCNKYEILDNIPLNSYIVTDKEDLYINIIKMIKKNPCHITFNDKEYSNNIKKLVNDLLRD